MSQVKSERAVFFEERDEIESKKEDIRDDLSLIHISEPTRPERISYAVFCLKKK